MKKILIVISDMGSGGAQRSLLSFLQCLCASEAAGHYQLHLMVVKPGGSFYDQIPSQVEQVPVPRQLRWLGFGLCRELFTKYFCWQGLAGEVAWLMGSRLKRFDRRLNTQQQLWECWKDRIPEDPAYYDVAIAYMDGFPNYYVMDKIHAGRKILWVHNEYQKLGYDADYDRRYFDACDGIITISEACRRCLLEAFREHEKKLHVLENISCGEAVLERSQEGSCPEFASCSGLKLLSVGRLNVQKGFDLAIGAAKLLQNAGVDFLWLVLGEGPERQSLQSLIDQAGLTEQFRLVGLRENPYVYMRHCDILVQSSRFEGRSVVLDEAKILCKPIVATNYTTVTGSVTHGESGWVVDMTEQGIFAGILRLHEDAALRQQLQSYLESQPKGNRQELENYIRIMLA